tara:strand:+ start:1223 stop:1735 length:513 start_codon:yes stop_codon:yes gene_type:complete
MQNKRVFPIKREKTEILNNRLYLRNCTTAPVTMQYDIRGVQTRHVHMPLIDERKKTTVNCKTTPVYNNKLMFTPSSSLPFNGYQENVDIETRLRGTVFPMQSCARAHYIPDSKSDLFDNGYLSQNNNNVFTPHALLEKKEAFQNVSHPNVKDLGYKLFHNHTKIQTKDIE